MSRVYSRLGGHLLKTAMKQAGSQPRRATMARQAVAMGLGYAMPLITAAAAESSLVGCGFVALADDEEGSVVPKKGR